MYACMHAPPNLDAPPSLELRTYVYWSSVLYAYAPGAGALGSRDG